MSANEYADRVALGSGLLSAAVAKRFLRYNKLPAVLAYLGGPIDWTTPGVEFGTMTIEVLRATVHAKVNEVEESCNVLHYITDPEIAITPELVATFGDAVRDNWARFLQGAGGNIGGGKTVSDYFGSPVIFDEVRAAHVQLVNGRAKWVGDTHFAPFTALQGQCHGAPLPAQIALVISFGTGGRGKSRRGRTYLGPLSTGVMNPDGLFQPALVGDIAGNWSAQMMVGMEAGDTGVPKFQLVVLSPATNARYIVTDLRVGRVPDTQRRRRKSFPEMYVAPRIT